jgi:hypothetical protein
MSKHFCFLEKARISSKISVYSLTNHGELFVKGASLALAVLRGTPEVTPAR